MRFGRGALVVALLAAGCTSTVSGAGSGGGGASCRPVFFGVAGSGQGPENPPPRALPRGVTRADGHAYGTAIGLLKTDLVRLAGGRLAATTAIDYPALGVDRYAGAGGVATNLDLSEGRGVVALTRAVKRSEQGRCLGRPVLIAGYSQGAEVVSRAVAALSPAQRAGVAVALFGNPSYQPGVAGDYPGTTRASGLRPALGGVPYRLPADVRSRTLDICAPGDPVCNMDPQRTTIVSKVAYLISNANVHVTAYAFGSADYPEQAARFLWRHR